MNRRRCSRGSIDYRFRHRARRLWFVVSLLCSHGRQERGCDQPKHDEKLAMFAADCISLGVSEGREFTLALFRFFHLHGFPASPFVNHFFSKTSLATLTAFTALGQPQ